MKRKKILFIFFVVLIFIGSLFLLINKDEPEFCPVGEDFCAEYYSIIPHFILHDITINKKRPQLIRIGDEARGIYVFPEILLKKSDVLMSYGIYDDNKFETDFAEISQKPAFGFDCGLSPNFDIHNTDLFTFQPECIGTDNFVLSDLVSTKIIHSFSEKIKELNIENKKIYLKMDIAGAELEPGIFDDILLHSDKITGISLVIHTDETKHIKQAIDLLNKIEKDFVLIARYTHHLHPGKVKLKTTKKTFGKGMSLTYINKNQIDSYKIKWNQDSETIKYAGETKPSIHSDILLYKYVPYIIKKHF